MFIRASEPLSAYWRQASSKPGTKLVLHGLEEFAKALREFFLPHSVPLSFPPLYSVSVHMELTELNTVGILQGVAVTAIVVEDVYSELSDTFTTPPARV